MGKGTARPVRELFPRAQFEALKRMAEVRDRPSKVPKEMGDRISLDPERLEAYLKEDPATAAFEIHVGIRQGQIRIRLPRVEAEVNPFQIVETGIHIRRSTILGPTETFLTSTIGHWMAERVLGAKEMQRDADAMWNGATLFTSSDHDHVTRPNSSVKQRSSGNDQMFVSPTTEDTSLDATSLSSRPSLERIVLLRSIFSDKKTYRSLRLTPLRELHLNGGIDPATAKSPLSTPRYREIVEIRRSLSDDRRDRGEFFRRFFDMVAEDINSPLHVLLVSGEDERLYALDRNSDLILLYLAAEKGIIPHSWLDEIPIILYTYKGGISSEEINRLLTTGPRPYIKFNLIPVNVETDQSVAVSYDRGDDERIDFLRWPEIRAAAWQATVVELEKAHYIPYPIDGQHYDSFIQGLKGRRVVVPSPDSYPPRVMIIHDLFQSAPSFKDRSAKIWYVSLKYEGTDRFAPQTKLRDIRFVDDVKEVLRQELAHLHPYPSIPPPDTDPFAPDMPERRAGLPVGGIGVLRETGAKILNARGDDVG